MWESWYYRYTIFLNITCHVPMWESWYFTFFWILLFMCPCRKSWYFTFFWLSLVMSPCGKADISHFSDSLVMSPCRESWYFTFYWLSLVMSPCRESWYFTFSDYLLIKSPKQTKFGRLIVFAPFLIIILILPSFRGPWTCPRQISGTTGQNFMNLCGIIDICF